MTFSSRKFYTGNGSQTQFTFDFGYLKPEHIYAIVDGEVAVFSWLDTGTVVLSSAPATGAVIEIYRETPKDRLVNYSDGSFLVEADLDLDSLQHLYISEEAFDIANLSRSDSTQTSAAAAQALETATQAKTESEQALSITSSMEESVQSAAAAAASAAAATEEAIALAQNSSHAHSNMASLDLMNIDTVGSFVLSVNSREVAFADSTVQTDGTNMAVAEFSNMLGLGSLANTLGTNIDIVSFKTQLAPRVVTTLAGESGNYVGEQIYRNAGDDDDDLYFWSGSQWYKVGL